VPVTQQPFDNQQPALAVTEVMTLSGIFPSGGGGGSATGDTLGFVYDFAGNFQPGDSLFLQGQLLSISANPVLFDLLGTTFGGDGTSTFALPNLQGTTTIGDGTGAGLATETLGVPTGSATITLSASQLPSSDPSLPGGGDGGGQPYSNLQPSLPLETLIATSGVFPSEGGSTGSATFIGQVANFAGNFIPSGWALAAGQLLPIASNTALFSILGTTYGGNGTTTFALPDLQGRVVVGADATDPLGTQFGQDATTLTSAQLPGGGVAGSTSPGQPVNNDQPSLALNYIIATSGIFPPNGSGAGFNSSTPTLGEIAAFAGNFAPSGWAFADGQILPIAGNTALFSILGTQYGGDGTTTFALPNLQGSTLVGTGTNASINYFTGDTVGADTVTLTVANLPPEDQPVTCFAAGTCIATPSGQIAVERLSPGDVVLIAAGQDHDTVRWIGHRRVDCARHPRPENVWPIRVQAGAFGARQPMRDLFLSPDHAVFVDDVLIPVKYLVNGTSIAQMPMEQVVYFHVEVAEHSILLADGLPVESYLDTGDRSDFLESAGPVSLYPDFASRIWEAAGYAPLVITGAKLDAIRRLVNARTQEAAHATVATAA
jgi:microcystin-dependent protein